ncbi:hypothetical protein SDC9_131066 [bioreactor metagenome]|uniref:Uncharacterized protein n=1 Tax=bioreactor metagenome TaxID=1076179 RepID=A0A645D3P2_9ZZZZ
MEGARIAIIAIFTSKASTFFPRYSGDRPTINPAMNTVRMINMTMPYMPAPTPPKIISPSIKLIMAIIPDNGDKLSCMAFTEPFDAAVVEVDQRMLLVIPNRVSFPSINGICPKTGLDANSEYNEIVNPVTIKMNIAAKIVQPCRTEPVILP